MTAGTLPSAFHVSHTSSFSLLVQKSLHLIFPNLVMGMVPLWDLCVCCSCLTRRKSSCRPSLGKALNVDKSQGAWPCRGARCSVCYQAGIRNYRLLLSVCHWLLLWPHIPHLLACFGSFASFCKQDQWQGSFKTLEVTRR